ncbi:hypothetical protein RGQ29_026644 [Quercus rubra]|uniref:Uncharacterized protein n=1 Tax=Quercus rubra TaxID=3512 RepID=A0AAN7IJE8_QUERU|nr:hypothetical protein RGQ29_026644 [Quercus rubra]KAK4575768.1 hypothetical protein RGQ29_026644 [Quercus rubra]
MKMEKPAENQICSSMWFSRTSLLCVAVLVPVFAYFLSFGFYPSLVTIPILVLSTLFVIAFRKKNVILDENPVQDEGHICDQKHLLGKEVGQTQTPQPLLETAIQPEVTQQNEVGVMHEYKVESPPDTLFPSDSESSNDSLIGENFEVNLMCSNHMDQDLAISDGSVSDEDDDSLIEISLPGSKSGGLDEEPKQKAQSNLPDLLPESIFQQQGLMELLAEINEMNEEENLIEIDLSMGSINQVFKVRD